MLIVIAAAKPKKSVPVRPKSGSAPAVKPKTIRKTDSSNVDTQAALNYLMSLLKQADRSATYNWIEKNQWGYYLNIRHWGSWEIPNDAYQDMEDGDEQDYDWEALTDESSNKLKKLLADTSKKYPRIKIQMNAEEKNWLTFQASSGKV